MKVSIKEVKIEALIHAPWNPRTEEELASNNPEIVKLSQSMRENGQLQPIGVWVGGDDGDLVIYGNRRLEAAKLAGMETLMAVVYEDLTIEEAQAKTREENENRMGVNPMQDAKLIKRMVDGGLTQQEIAAKTGLSEATVCRRMKLTNLDLSIAKKVALDKFETKALELIAAQDPEMQHVLAKNVSRYSYQQKITFSDVSRCYCDLTATVNPNDWCFAGEAGADRLAKCRACGKCTGNQPTLFDGTDIEGEAPYDSSENRCLDIKCYRDMHAEAKKQLIDEAIAAAGGADRRVEEHWMGGEFKAKKYSKKNPCAHFTFDAGKVTVKYGPDPKIAEAERARENEERRAEQERRDRQRNLLDSVSDKVREFFGENEGVAIEKLRDLLEEHFACYESRFDVLRDIFVNLVLGIGNIDDDADKEDALKAMNEIISDKSTPEKDAENVVFLWGKCLLDKATSEYHWNRNYGIIHWFIVNFAIPVEPDELAALESEEED